MIFDTDVLIWFFRGNEKAKKIVRENMPFSISKISIISTVDGQDVENSEHKWEKIVNQNNDIYIYVSDSMELADALIAATSVVNDETLCTANGKHYKCIPELQMSVFKVE